jgi:hypothetical protein
MAKCLKKSAFHDLSFFELNNSLKKTFQTAFGVEVRNQLVLSFFFLAALDSFRVPGLF